MSDISTVSAVLALVLSIASAFIAARVAVLHRELWERFKTSDASRMESLAQSVREVEAALEVVATSVRMSRVRRAATEREQKTSELPDPYRDPDGWRNAVNARLGQQKHGL